MRSLIALLVLLTATRVLGDGKVVAPRGYRGSLEEEAQEGIIIYESDKSEASGKEDMILKIRVAGEAASFAWVIPFPSEPKIAKEDPKLFKELFDYVEARTRQTHSMGGGGMGGDRPMAAKAEKPAVDVLSRRIVGSYDTAVVREKKAGALNEWLRQEGFQTLDGAEDVIGYYRKKGYVFACIKVSDVELAKNRSVESHPLRFTFKTGGRDGIYFPMKMTGLQEKPFSVNLYVFYGAWINGKLNEYGYVHRGFSRRFRDWDSPQCKPNAGKAWSAPQHDPYLRDMAQTLPTVTELFQTLHPGERYYLTNIQAFGLKPGKVREWSNDLWLFPYYIDRQFVPFDARAGGPAAN